jgi:hypothetical protein
VAVLDTGVDYTRAAFGACSAPGPGCRVKYAADFAPDDHALDANGHGTNVAGIVAGVAPGADLIALDVFNGQYAYTSDVLAAMAWCVEHRAEYNIVAINLSLGQGGYTGPCVDGFTAAIHAARAAGITVVAAAGNDGRADRLSSPACSAEAVSVGAVYDSDLGGIAYPGCTDAATAADAIACFSNSSRYLSLLAPGAIITAAGVSMVGTSQAAPHVAGALAVLRAATPGMTGDAAVASLKATGKRIADRRNGVVTPRVDLSSVTVNGCPAWLSAVGTLAGEGGAATASLSLPPSCPWTASSSAGWLQVAPAGGSGAAGIVLSAGPNLGASRSATVTVAGRVITVTQDADRTPPTGSVTLVGAPPVQRTLGVTLALTAADVTGVPSMCLSNGPACSAWEPFAATRAWTLAPGPSGVRTVHVHFRDGAGNVSADLTRSIAYDVTPPVGGVLAVEVGDGRVDLRWSGFQDPGSGVVGLRLVRDTSAVPAAGCRGGTVLYTGLGGAYTDLAVENGVLYHYRLCAVDGLGNVSPGIVRDARPSAGRGPAGGRTQG